MEPALRSAVDAIHASPVRSVLYLTGGASQALGWLLSVPGASNTVLEAVVPYSRQSLLELAGKKPSQFTSRATAQDLALAAYNRALTLGGADTNVVGVGCTCALTSVTPKKGDHRCFVAARTQAALLEYSITLTKGARDRAGEDKVASALVLQALASASGVSVDFPREPSGSHDEVIAHEITSFTEEQQLEALLRGETHLVLYGGRGGPGWQKGSTGGGGGGDVDSTAEEGRVGRTTVPLAELRPVVLPGSFNPVHEGHLEMMDAACRLLPNPEPWFELSVVNPDKPALVTKEITRRARQFVERGLTLVVTDAPLFATKADILPNSTFVVGVDTAVRLFQPKYYGSHDRMVAVLSGIRNRGCDFVVAGRKVDGQFLELSDVTVPPEVADIFQPIPADSFRRDISSTEIRARMGKQSS